MTETETTHIRSRKLFDEGFIKSRYSYTYILKNGAVVGTILVKHPPVGRGEGRLTVALTQNGEAPDQIESATGYNYNKVQACIEGMEFQGLVFPKIQSWKGFLIEQGFQVIGQ